MLGLNNRSRERTEGVYFSDWERDWDIKSDKKGGNR